MLRDKNLKREKIETKLTRIVDIIDSIDKKLPDDFYDFKKMDFEKDGVYKRIEFVIWELIDICFIINLDLRLGIPEEEDNIFDNLEKNKILSKRTLRIIREMKGFRNILVHKYGNINDKRAFDSIREGLKDFESIIDEIEKFLKKK